MSDSCAGRLSSPRAGRLLGGILLLTALLLAGLVSAGCAGPETDKALSPAEREASLRQIAADYARDDDLGKAQAALAEMQIANPGQLLLSLAEQGINEGRAPGEIVPLAHLADALGVHSPKVIAYLAPTVAPSPPPPTPIPLPPTLTQVATTIPAVTDTPVPPTPSPVPPSPTPTQQPHIVADSTVNLRSGPGTAYPIVGRAQTGQEYRIIGRNASGDWWQLAWDGQGQAWVAGSVVSVVGPIDSVVVAKDIPAPPPTRTPAPPPPPTQPPKPAVDFAVKSVRLRSVGEDSQRCDSGENSIYVTVLDPAGNPLDGVHVREIFSGRVFVTGDQGKGPGRVQYDIYRGGGGQMEIIDETGNRISEVSRGMSADWPDFDLLKAAGYCNCKPHPDDASCEADWASKNYLFAVGHYTYEVVFQRTW